MGKVALVNFAQVRYYEVGDDSVRGILWTESR